VFLLFPFVLLGCCKPEYITVPCQSPPPIERPVLAEIPVTAEPKEQVRGLVILIQQLESYAAQLEAALEGYR
jgi:hypothetical protein